MERIIRVFPRRTSYTPRDDMAFVGWPPLMRPEADRVMVSCAFTWDRRHAVDLAEAWSQYYAVVKLGGPAFDSPVNGFTPGMFVKPGVVFTSRGCDAHCSWCLVPKREGHLRLLDPIPAGHIIQDNSFLQCPLKHRHTVYEMLMHQPKAIFAGGLQVSLITDQIADELQGLRLDTLFMAADTEGALRPLEQAIQRLPFLSRRQLRCYVLVGYGEETIEQARQRLEAVWDAGALPFCQLYQPPDSWRAYLPEWRSLARTWSRPAAMFAIHGGRS